MTDEEALVKGIETKASVRKRGQDFLTLLLEKQDKNVIVFSHAATIFNTMNFIKSQKFRSDCDLSLLDRPPSNCHYHEIVIERDFSFELLKLNSNK